MTDVAVTLRITRSKGKSHMERPRPALANQGPKNRGCPFLLQRDEHRMKLAIAQINPDLPRANAKWLGRQIEDVLSTTR